MKLSGFRWAACAAILSTASAAGALEGPKFELHGFIGGSLYAQDAVFNDSGQKVFFVTKTPNADRAIFGGDVRQTRLNFSVTGPEIPKILRGAVPKGVVEIDWFGPTNLASSTTISRDASGNVTKVTVNQTSGTDFNLVPRLRLAYAELAWAPLVLRIGQDTVLVAGLFPVTVGHIAQPFSLGSGLLFSREQMVEAFYTIRTASDMRIEVAAQVMKPTSNAAKLDPVTGLSYAESSGLPGVEGRVRVVLPKLLEVFVAGHWNRIDRDGADNVEAAKVPAHLGNQQTVAAGDVGAKLTLGGFTVQGAAFVGKNIGYQSNFDPVPDIDQGDLHEWGAWGQVGYDITPEFSAWAFIGTDHPNYGEVKAFVASGDATANATWKLQNTTTHAMLRYQEGGFALGLEYLHMITHYVSRPANSGASKGGVLEGNQIMLSGMYFF